MMEMTKSRPRQKCLRKRQLRVIDEMRRNTMAIVPACLEQDSASDIPDNGLRHPAESSGAYLGAFAEESQKSARRIESLAVQLAGLTDAERTAIATLFAGRSSNV